MTIFIFGMLGYLVHLLSSWADYCRTTARVHLTTYIQLDLAGWIAATAGTAVVLLVTIDIDPLLPFHVGKHLLPVLLGYTGSSVLAKLASIVGLGTGER